MEIIKVIGFAFVALVVIIVLKSLKKEDLAILACLIASIILFVYLFLKLDGVITLLDEIIKKAGINKEYLTILLKVTGISYIIELASNICKDAGVLSLSSKVEMIGKVTIVILTIPILTKVIEVILKLV